ncbi:MAG: enoyl-CoA hydratase/isomerase family protein [Silicimonas sp.]
MANFVNTNIHDGVALVTLARPERLNAISLELTRDLHAALVEVNADKDVRSIIFSGEGRAFCAGDDLKEFDAQSATVEATVAHIKGIQQITRDLMFSEKFVVGAIHGFAVGGGFEWLLNCDVIVAADDLVAFFPEMEWGQFPTGAVTHLLPQAIGHQQAMELLVLGERQSAEMLARRGLVNWVVPAADVAAKAEEVARLAASKSPFSVGHLKKLLTQDLTDGFQNALTLEEDITITAFQTDEAKARSANFPTR